MLSAEQIAEAKTRVRCHGQDNPHEHDDCIRIAYEWLDAQTTTKGFLNRTHPIKHFIERWGGRYVSSSDVQVAAEIHPRIKGKYPHFNISSRLTLPSDRRLADISEARTQSYQLTSAHITQTYFRIEEP